MTVLGLLNPPLLPLWKRERVIWSDDEDGGVQFRMGVGGGRSFFFPSYAVRVWETQVAEGFLCRSGKLVGRICVYMGCVVYPCEGISIHVYMADFVRGAGKDGTGRVWCSRGTSQRPWVCVLKFFQVKSSCAACKINNKSFRS